eukprot:g36978.t1
MGLERTHGGNGVEFGLVQYPAASVASALARFGNNSQWLGYWWRREDAKERRLLSQQQQRGEGVSCLAIRLMAEHLTRRQLLRERQGKWVKIRFGNGTGHRHMTGSKQLA